MKARYLLAAVAVAAVLSVLTLTGGRAPASAQTPQTQSDYIVVLNDNLPDVFGIIAQIERLQGVQSRLRFSTALSGFSARLTSARSRRCSASPGCSS